MNSLETILGEHTSPESIRAVAYHMHQLERTGAIYTSVGDLSTERIGFENADTGLTVHARWGDPSGVAAIALGTNRNFDDVKDAMSEALSIAATRSWQSFAFDLFRMPNVAQMRLYEAVRYTSTWIRLQSSGLLRDFSGSKRNIMAHVRPFHGDDVNNITQFLSRLVVDPDTGGTSSDEVARYAINMLQSFKGETSRRYLVAETHWRLPVGVIGLQPVSEMIRHYCMRVSAREIVNFYVDPHFQNEGIGSKLLKILERTLVADGCDEAVLCSTPRYAQSWPIYEHAGFELRGTIEMIHNKQVGARVYGKELTISYD